MRKSFFLRMATNKAYQFLTQTKKQNEIDHFLGGYCTKTSVGISDRKKGFSFLIFQEEMFPFLEMFPKWIGIFTFLSLEMFPKMDTFLK